MTTVAERNAAFDVVQAELEKAGQHEPAQEILNIVDMALDAGSRADAFPAVRAEVNRLAGAFSWLIKDKMVKDVIDKAYKAAEKARAKKK